MGGIEFFKPIDIDLLKDFYNATNHTATNSEISVKTGVSIGKYNSVLGNTGKRIANALNFSTNLREDNSERWWSVLFRGCRRKDGLFEWQVKPELVEALEALYPELLLTTAAIDAIVTNKEFLADEFDADNEERLATGSNDALIKSDFTEFVGVPREIPELIETQRGKRYKRDKQRSVNALNRANYLCEYNPLHETFLRKNANVNYTESHHLVPMAFQSLFSVTLDTESNIVSLCSNCHNQIHYGQGAHKIIATLYEQRKAALEKEGIVITLEKLLAMYN